MGWRFLYPMSERKHRIRLEQISHSKKKLGKVTIEESLSSLAWKQEFCRKMTLIESQSKPTYATCPTLTVFGSNNAIEMALVMDKLVTWLKTLLTF
jgi:hypothetical protein